MSNYIDDITDLILDRIGTCPRELTRLYALLCLTKGERVTNRDVHDAWSAWRVEIEPDHRSLVPFDQLTPDVQELDTPYRIAIREVAKEYAIGGHGSLLYLTGYNDDGSRGGTAHEMPDGTFTVVLYSHAGEVHVVQAPAEHIGKAFTAIRRAGASTFVVVPQEYAEEILDRLSEAHDHAVDCEPQDGGDQ